MDEVLSKKSSSLENQENRSAGSDGIWISSETYSQLRNSLQEAQDTLDAIRNGEVDAVVVSGNNGSQIYSLSGAEHPYRIYVEQMQEGAVTVTADGLILYCNQRFAEMMGQPLEQVISSGLSPRLPEETWAQISSVLENHGSVVKHESLLFGQAGEMLPVHLTASLLPLPEQNVICLVVTDLSLQKSGEEMRLAKEIAERANVAKDSFLAALSHELRTPLTPALMGISALQSEPSMPPGALAHVAMIRRNIELEIRLIDDLLDLTRIAHGKFELQEDALDAHEVLRRAVDICRSSFDAKGIALTLEMGASHTQTAADSVRLQQVFWNLIRNAIKFTPSGGSVRIVTDNPDPDSLHLAVIDTGIGFNPAEETQLFHPFEQIGREITRQFGGLGLGLSISRSIMTAHGGKIWGESEGPGRGAAFHVELPLRPCEARPSTMDSGAPGSPASHLRILVVEDHEDTRNIFRMMLERQGHHLETAGTAEEALALAGRQGFDLVISDLGLPDRPGTELMTQLRDRHGLIGIAVSGFGMEDDIRLSREAGFFHHLTKPIEPARLNELIAAIASEIQETRRPRHPRHFRSHQNPGK